MNIERLKRDDLPYRWKVQTAKEWGCECVAYIDARQVMEVLDDAVGPENWQSRFYEVSGKTYCAISILVNGQWVEKASNGTPSQFEADKGQSSDAFKRAAVMWGIGRFLYAIPTVRTKSIQAGQDDRGRPRYVPADEQGKKIHNLTQHINSLRGNKGQQKQGYKPKAQTPVAAPAPPKAPVTAQSNIVDIADLDQRLVRCWDLTGKLANQFSAKLQERPEYTDALLKLGGDAPLPGEKVTVEELRALGLDKIKACYEALQDYKKTIKEKRAN